MKVFLIVLISSLFIFKSFGQLQPSNFAMKSAISQSLLKNAKKIMKKLGFCIRENLKKDGEVVFYIRPNLDDLQAAFEYYNSDVDKSANNDNLRFYNKSRIWLTGKLDSILSGLTNTPRVTFIKSKAIFVHELVHYLQCSNVVNHYQAHFGSYMDATEYLHDMRKYINQIDEFEAWSVESYFFLEKYNYALLVKIMQSKVTLRRKCELLINQYRLIDVPTNPPLFNN